MDSSKFIRCSLFPILEITIDKYVQLSGEDYDLEDDLIKLLINKYSALSLTYDAMSYFDKIPKTITQLRIDFPNYENININALHNGIKELVILSEASVFDHNDKSFNKQIDNLPNTLERLSIVSSKFNQSLDNLPQSLKELYISSDNFNMPLIIYHII